MNATVLIADDDRDIRTFVEVSLSLAGFTIVEAEDGQQALELALEHSPDIIVLDVMMPRMDGYTALRKLRLDGRLSHIPVILLTAKTQTHDKLEGFGAGADDFLTKPFDPSELVARLQATLRRAADMRAVQPLTGLPGNTAIDRELERRVDAGQAFALMHADLNNFKAYNDHYGYSRGDEVLMTFSSIVVDAAREICGAETFVGHVGGDDFVIVTDTTLWEPLSEAICERFDAAVPDLYDPQDRDAGHITMPDRQGVDRSYPLVAVSIGVAVSAPEGFERPEEAITVANEMKTFAKHQVEEGGSNVEVDRRRSPPDADG